MENKKEERIAVVPLIALQSEQTSHDRTVKRLIIALIISILINLAVVGIAAYERLQYDYVGESNSYMQDGDGVNNFNNGTQGDVN